MGWKRGVLGHTQLQAGPGKAARLAICGRLIGRFLNFPTIRAGDMAIREEISEYLDGEMLDAAKEGRFQVLTTSDFARWGL